MAFCFSARRIENQSTRVSKIRIPASLFEFKKMVSKPSLFMISKGDVITFIQGEGEGEGEGETDDQENRLVMSSVAHPK